MSPSSAEPRVPATTAVAAAAAAAPAAERPTLSIVDNLACAAIARSVSIFTMFPVDTIKTRVQVSPSVIGVSPTTAGTTAAASRAAHPLASITSAVSRGGLYNGVTVSLTGQVPYGMFSFGLYESVRSHLRTVAPALPDWLHILLAACVGDAVGSLWLTPTEVIKSKTQTAQFASTAATVRAVAANGPTAFYQGYPAALARDVPFRFLQMFLFERCRAFYIHRVTSTQGRRIAPWENLLVGAVSGSLAAMASTPLDVIRTRMMSQPPGNSALYRNALHCLAKTVSTEGPQALFRGIVPRTLLIGPASAIFFVTYEAARSFFNTRYQRRRHHRTPRTSAASITPIRARRRARFV